MKRALLATLVICLACGRSEPPMPEGLLPRETFKEVLLGAHLLEARSRQLLSTGVVLDGTLHTLEFDSLYAAHGTDSATFRATFNAYADRPQELKAVYEEVLTEITRRKDGPAQ